jgi:hypothetical protein
MNPVNAKMLADVFNLTETRVHQLAAREGMPKLARAKFDLISCIKWYMKYLRTKLRNAPSNLVRKSQKSSISSSDGCEWLQT